MDGLQSGIRDSVTIVVASQPSLIRYGLRSVLNSLRPAWAVSEADTLDMAIEILGQDTNALILLDVTLPGAGTADAVQRMCERLAHPRILVLADDGERDEILHWIDSGARGYLTKSCADTQVICAIETVLFGGIFAPATLSASFDKNPPARHDALRQQPDSAPGARQDPMASPADVAASAARSVDLTERQRAVLELVLQGYNTKMIARQLGIAVATAKVHLAAIYRLMGARDRSEAIVKANRHYALAMQAGSQSSRHTSSSVGEKGDVTHAASDAAHDTLGNTPGTATLGVSLVDHKRDAGQRSRRVQTRRPSPILQADTTVPPPLLTRRYAIPALHGPSARG